MIRGMVKVVCLWFCVGLYSFGAWASSSTLWFADEREQLAQAELKQQLLLLSIAEVDPAFSQQWYALGNDELSQGERSARLVKVYGLVEAFWRDLYLRSPGENLLSQPFRLSVRAEVEQELRDTALTGSLIKSVLSLEPLVANYLVYRNRVFELHQLSRRPRPTVSAWGVIYPGHHDVEVDAVRRILSDLGDYHGSDQGHYYDFELEEGVRRFQKRHGLAIDGVIGPETRKWLSLPYGDRARMLARSMIRQVHDRHHFSENYLLVNIPDFRLSWMARGEEIWRTRVVVGRPSRPTPTMHNRIKSVVVNPDWNVPSTILRKDLLPKIRANGNFVTANRYEVVDRNNQILNFSADEVSELAATGFPYRLRQKPGRGNALGRYKFFLPNSRAIYLHDTPQQNLFGRSSRAFSSGCIRVEGADQLADMLLRDHRKADKLPDYLATSRTRWLKLAEPVDVYLVYWNAWIKDGLAQFRGDIYNRDRRSDSFYAFDGVTSH